MTRPTTALPRRPRRRISPFVRGFTLLELLVAIGVFALFSTMAYGGLMQILESRDRVDAERTYWTGLARAFLRIEDDLLHARERSVRSVSGTPLPALQGQPTDTRAVADPPLEFTRGGVLTLSEGARSDLQRVAYKFEDGKLWRLTWPVLDRAPTTKPQETVLLEDVEDFQARFFGGVPVAGAPAAAPVAAAPPSAQATWPPTGGSLTALPQAVELTIKLRGRGELKRVFLVNG
jgi:general secretion pathway protein J